MNMATDLPGRFEKSSYSSGSQNCVEVAAGTQGIAMWMRDSKNPAEGALPFPTTEWSAFLGTANK